MEEDHSIRKDINFFDGTDEMEKARLALTSWCKLKALIVFLGRKRPKSKKKKKEREKEKGRRRPRTKRIEEEKYIF